MRQETRLARLEQRVRALSGEPLLVLYQTPDGSEHTGSVDDMIQADGNMVKVLSGGRLADLDKMIDAFLDAVMGGMT